MKRVLSLVLCATIFIVSLSSCAVAQPSTTYVDGTYNASFKNFDSYGYKDFVRIVVKDGVITAVEYDAVNADGRLRSEDFDYEEQMEGQKDTYPRRYSSDLANQFLERKNLDDIDAVAGATWSSDCFKALVTALESSMTTGNTELVLVDNVPER